MLGAFGGFMHKPFREHDFALGRRNCQKFLRDQFIIPFDHDAKEEPLLENPLFGPLVKCYLDGTLSDELSEFIFFKQNDEQGKERTYLRILPIVGDATLEAKKIPWHRIAVNETRLNDVAGALRKRLKATLDQQLNAKMGGLVGTVVKWGIQAASWALSFKLKSMIFEKMKQSAETYGLLKK